MKKLLSMVVIMATIVGSFSTVTFGATPGVVKTMRQSDGTTLQNVSANKYVWASSYVGRAGGGGTREPGVAGEHLSYFPSCAVDNAPSVVNNNYGWISQEATTTADNTVLAKDANPWIAVDLGKPYRPEFIDIYIKREATHESTLVGNVVNSGNIEIYGAKTRTESAPVQLNLAYGENNRDKATLDAPVKLYEGKLEATTGESVGKMRIPISDAAKYRYIKVGRPAGNDQTLCIQEIMVYAQDKSNLMNLSAGKAFTTNVGPYGVASENAVHMGLTDGKVADGGHNDTGFANASVDHARATIDLGAKFKIERITFVSETGIYVIGHNSQFNRGDFEIYGGNVVDNNPEDVNFGHVAGKGNIGGTDLPKLTAGTKRILNEKRYTGPAGSIISEIVDDMEPVRYLTFRKTGPVPQVGISEIIVYGYEETAKETVELELINQLTFTTKYDANTFYITFNTDEYYEIERIEIAGDVSKIKNFEIYAEAKAFYGVHDLERRVLIAEQGNEAPIGDKYSADIDVNIATNAISISPKPGAPSLSNVTFYIYGKKNGKMANVAIGKTATGTNGDAAVVDQNLDSLAEHPENGTGIVVDLTKPTVVNGVDIETRTFYVDMLNSKSYYDVLGSNNNTDFELVAQTTNQGTPAHGKVTIMFPNDKPYRYIKVLPKAGEFIGSTENYSGSVGRVKTNGYDVITDIRVYSPTVTAGGNVVISSFKFTDAIDGNGSKTGTLDKENIGVQFSITNLGDTAIPATTAILVFYSPNRTVAQTKIVEVASIEKYGSANVTFGVKNPLYPNDIMGGKAVCYLWSKDAQEPLMTAKPLIYVPGRIYVAPNGKGDGDVGNPASLESAIAMVSGNTDGVNSDITIDMAPGDYFFEAR